MQANAPGEIPLVEINPSSGITVSGLVTQKVNVRNGPGTTYESLGVLNPNDVVFITGRDSGSKWVQVEFADTPDGKGWVTAEFLQAGNFENVPLIGGEEEIIALTAVIPTAADSTAPQAMLDGDSMQSPLTTVSFSPTGSRALQVNGDVSAPDGDVEDWIQFNTTQGGVVKIKVTCSGAALRVELWNQESPVDDFSCGGSSLEITEAGSNYFLRLMQNEPGYMGYTLNLEFIP
jgi:hypothetical protein